MFYQIEEIKNKIICGNALQTLKKIPSDSIDMAITSPPYFGLRSYLPNENPNKKYEIGLESSFEEFMDKMLKIMKEIKRVLKPTGTCWINFGDAYGGQPAGNKYISEANVGTDGLYVRKMKQTAGAKSFVPNFSGDGKLSKKHSGRARGQLSGSKCLLMMPERFAIRCIDELGFILRNKIIWAKQVLFFNKDGSKYTKGSVMPTSAKDRFNQSYEYLFFFTKSKKYYSNLDAVRLPPQTELNFERPRIGQGNQTIYEQKRAPGVVRQRLYPESKYNKFNYRVRDAEKKAGQPQFKASQEEISRYQQEKLKVYPKGQGGHIKSGGINSPEGQRRYLEKLIKASQEEIEAYKQKTGKIKGGGAKLFNLPRARTQRDFNQRWQELKEKSYGNDDKKDRRSRVRAFMDTKRNKVNDPRGTHFGGPGSWRDFKDENEGLTNPLGKNIPVIWQINPEPHNFQKELGEEFTEHFACVDEETEALTLSGWKKYNELKTGEIIASFNLKTGQLEWDIVKDIFISDYNGAMIYFSTLNMMLTPNHRVIRKSRNKKEENYSIKEAKDITTHDAIPIAADWSEGSYRIIKNEPSPDMCEILGWICAEGHFRDFSVVIYQSVSANPEKVKRIENLLEKENIDFTARRQKRISKISGKEFEMICFSISWKNFKRIFPYIPDKKPTLLMLGWSKEGIKRFLNGFIMGDGHIRKDDNRITITQKDEKVIDILMLLAFRLGYSIRKSFKKEYSKSPAQFVLYLTRKRNKQIRTTNGKKMKEIVNYNGKIWCPKTGNTTWVARRGGYIFITGNTFPQALLETPIKFGCPPNGIVLDPFAGSFTTALVAEKLGRNWICIDLSEDYCKLGQARIYKWRKENKSGLFNEPPSPPPIIKGF